MEKQRLSKVLAAAGIASRRHCEKLIFTGKVTLNGEVCLIPQTRVCPKSDEIMVDDQKIGEQKKVYYILNKPTGYICSAVRIGTKRLVLDLFSGIDKRLFTIGRLDRDTSGLLLLTNDGHFAQKVIHPSANITKEYLIKTVEEITHEHLESISEGVAIEGHWIKPTKVTKMRRGTLKIAVKEGKKHEVRLLILKAGLQLLELKRIRIGGLLLGPLEEGAFREMTQKEKLALFS